MFTRSISIGIWLLKRGGTGINYNGVNDYNTQANSQQLALDPTTPQDGQPGGTDKNADVSASSEASLISTWFEYTPTNAMDIGVTMHPPGGVPAQPSPDIA